MSLQSSKTPAPATQPALQPLLAFGVETGVFVITAAPAQLAKIEAFARVESEPMPRFVMGNAYLSQQPQATGPTLYTAYIPWPTAPDGPLLLGCVTANRRKPVFKVDCLPYSKFTPNAFETVIKRFGRALLPAFKASLDPAHPVWQLIASIAAQAKAQPQIAAPDSLTPEQTQQLAQQLAASSQVQHPQALQVMLQTFSRACQQQAAGQPQLARAAYQRLQTILGNNPLCHCKIAETWLLEDQPAHAVAAYQAAIQLSPSLVWPWLGLGNAYQRMGQPLQAESAYRAIFAFAPNSGMARTRLLALRPSAQAARQVTIRPKSPTN